MDGVFEPWHFIAALITLGPILLFLYLLFRIVRKL